MSASSPVVTRFAPSPTGDLHIGGARTALFNYLYAKHFGGQFLLRIEDTDRERSTPEAVQAIFEGLDWLGLRHDGEVTYQFSRADRHREVVQTLLDTGHAYRCFMTADETEAARELARAEGRAVRSSWRDRTPTEDELKQPHVIRFRGPGEGTVIVHDRVQGDVQFNAKDLDDLVLLRSDGAPTYNLAVVVDDHDMGVTHIIRGDDHLNNAARQTLIYQAMGWSVPDFAHIPLIHGPDGKKLSKRHGATAVGEYGKLGYLPEAMRNYLVRLGWSHGDAEIFTDEEAISWFDMDAIGKAPARLDFDKLAFINAHWILQADEARLADLVIQEAKLPESEHAALRSTLPFVKDRAKTLTDFVGLTAFARAQRPLTVDDKTKKALDDEGKARFGRLSAYLKGILVWNLSTLEGALKDFAVQEGVGFGKIGPVLRGMISGGHPAPDLAKALCALGQEETLARLNEALGQSH